jgi:hypothetical protein
MGTDEEHCINKNIYREQAREIGRVRECKREGESERLREREQSRYISLERESERASK